MKQTAGSVKLSLAWRIRIALSNLRMRVLESKAHEGLGGPPNNWQHSPKFTSRQHGMSNGIKQFNLSFTNDAFDVGVWVEYDDSPGKWDFMIAAEDFRKIALWYLGRWIFGEWFGLRRKLYYWDLTRRMDRFRKSHDLR